MPTPTTWIQTYIKLHEVDDKNRVLKERSEKIDKILNRIKNEIKSR